MEPDMIWQSQIENYSVVIESIGENMWRGNLKIYNSEGELRYQREVSVKRGLEVGGDTDNFREWEKVITTWIHQYS
jgi:hypothetical protein